MQALPISLATTFGISVDVFSSSYLDVSVHSVRLSNLCIQFEIPFGGFPHSEISGSKLTCQLPEAYRRLSRPSSPVIAKASTTCTYSLDPINLRSHIDSLNGNISTHRIEKRPDRLAKLLKNDAKGVEITHEAITTRLDGGGERDRTDDPLLAKQVLSQLSYTPNLVGLVGFEPTTPALSRRCSNRLSYRPYGH